MAMTRFCPIARLLAGAMILLSGCSAIEGDYANVKCPDTGVISGLGTVSRFDGVGNGFANLAYRASLTKEKSDCAVDAGGVTIMLTLSGHLQAGQGPHRRRGRDQRTYPLGRSQAGVTIPCRAWVPADGYGAGLQPSTSMMSARVAGPRRDA
jgi:hypothetical protein